MLKYIKFDPGYLFLVSSFNPLDLTVLVSKDPAEFCTHFYSGGGFKGWRGGNSGRGGTTGGYTGGGCDECWTWWHSLLLALGILATLFTLAILYICFGLPKFLKGCCRKSSEGKDDTASQPLDVAGKQGDQEAGNSWQSPAHEAAGKFQKLPEGSLSNSIQPHNGEPAVMTDYHPAINITDRPLSMGPWVTPEQTQIRANEPLSYTQGIAMQGGRWQPNSNNVDNSLPYPFCETKLFNSRKFCSYTLVQTMSPILRDGKDLF